MAISITTTPDYSNGFIFSDDSNVYEWTSTESGNDGFYTRVRITSSLYTIYEADVFGMRFDLKDALTSLVKLNPSNQINSLNFNITFQGRWVNNGQVVVGGGQSVINRVALKGTAGEYAIRLSGFNKVLSNIPQNANYYTGLPSYYSRSIIAVDNSLNPVSLIKSSFLNGPALTIECQDKIAQLYWRNNFGAIDDFIFTHNLEENINSRGITWGYPNNRDIVKEFSKGFTIHSGYINTDTYKWLVEELLTSPLINLNIQDWYGTGKHLDVVVTVDMQNATYKTTEFDGLINLSLPLKLSKQYKSIRL